jgi:hypothetical protein
LSGSASKVGSNCFWCKISTFFPIFLNFPTMTDFKCHDIIFNLYRFFIYQFWLTWVRTSTILRCKSSSEIYLPLCDCWKSSFEPLLPSTCFRNCNCDSIHSFSSVFELHDALNVSKSSIVTHNPQVSCIFLR